MLLVAEFSQNPKGNIDQDQRSDAFFLNSMGQDQLALGIPMHLAGQLQIRTLTSPMPQRRPPCLHLPSSIFSLPNGPQKPAVTSSRDSIHPQHPPVPEPTSMTCTTRATMTRFLAPRSVKQLRNVVDHLL